MLSVFWAWITTQGRIDVSEEYLRSTIDYVEMDRPRRLEFDRKLTITQWTRFPIYETADLGWRQYSLISLHNDPHTGCIYSPTWTPIPLNEG
ncbi:unnamed protein product [Linum tenue]|uniref:Uncharacterized protein n=1 Tax=Linum tenue TaxID=586396 RepID=A0AAV0IYY3_9ROSI|nr:unnamed protein product [Linum tenue]CAI0402619.1 unnamed protein product [Linum tenue]